MTGIACKNLKKSFVVKYNQVMKLTAEQSRLNRDQIKKVAKLDNFRLILKGKTAVFIDWANVYGWSRSLKKEVNPRRLYKYLRQYPQIKDVNFYYGIDKHPKSKKFLDEVKKIGFNVVSKKVKYIPVSLDSSHFRKLGFEIKDLLKSIDNLKLEDIEKILQILSRKVLRRKCDFDMEICIDAHKAIQDVFETFVFFSGDGDFAPLYKLLIGLRKQVIVIFAHGHMGKEIYQINKGIFTKAVDKLEVDLFV